MKNAHQPDRQARIGSPIKSLMLPSIQAIAVNSTNATVTAEKSVIISFDFASALCL